MRREGLLVALGTLCAVCSDAVIPSLRVEHSVTRIDYDGMAWCATWHWHAPLAARRADTRAPDTPMHPLVSRAPRIHCERTTPI